MIFAEILNNNKILVHEKNDTNPISDSVKFESVKFRFPRRWKDYTKTAVFTSGEDKSFNILLSKENPLCLSDEECYIPHEILLEDEFYLSVFGVLGDSIATTTRVKIIVAESGYALGDEPGEPTENEYQQIIGMMEQTKQIAQSVRNDADSGLFNGEKGEKGDKGDKGDKGEKGDKGDRGEAAIVEQIYDPVSENAVSGKALSVVFAPIIKAEKSGSFITVSDALETEHTVNIKVQGIDNNWLKNATPTIFKNTDTYTYNGITFTLLSDGSIKVDGTATSFMSLQISPLWFDYEIGKTYYLSGCPSGGSATTYYLKAETSDHSKSQMDTGSGVSFSMDGLNLINVFLVIEKDAALSNKVFKPYFSDVSQSVTTSVNGTIIDRVGKNLFDGKLKISDDGKLCSKNSIRVKPNTNYVISESNGKKVVFNVYGTYKSNVISAEAFVLRAKGVTAFNSGNARNLKFETVETAENLGLTVDRQIQLEEGTAATEFEKYVRRTVIADANGNTAVPSVVGINTFFVSNEAVFTAEYLADTKKYIDECIKRELGQ